MYSRVWYQGVLVIGGTGLMGVPTVTRLLDAGRHVVVMSRGNTQGQGTSGRRPKLPAGAETLVCDRADDEAFVSALCEPSCPRIVVDFTAMEPSHVESVYRAHERMPFAHYVFVSTNMVYPGGVENMDVSATDGRIEESAVRRGRSNQAPCNYGGNKLKCEALLLRYAASATPLRSSIVRPPAVVGAGCDPRHEKLQRLVLGLPPLDERKARPPAKRPGRRFRVACADDVAQVIAALVDRPASACRDDVRHAEEIGPEIGPPATGGSQPTLTCEAFNVASGDAEGYDLGEYVAALAAALDSSSGGAPPPVPDALRNYEKQGVLDTSKAEAELGFVPTPLSAWMAETVAWHAPLLASLDVGE